MKYSVFFRTYATTKVILLAICFFSSPAYMTPLDNIITEKRPVVDTLHGIPIIDNYRWLEDRDDLGVTQWLTTQETIARQFIDTLPQRTPLIKRFDELWRYDDERTPQQVIESERLFYWVKTKEWERWAYYYKENASSNGVMLLNPNEWGDKTLDFVVPSRDGKYIAYGIAEAGDEATVVHIMEVLTRKVLADSLRGWRQRSISWFPGNVGFYYTASPLKGEVPEGEEQYWSTAYYHTLGTGAESDIEVFSHDEVKEYYHGVSVSEDGKHVLFYRSLFNKNSVYLSHRAHPEKLIPITTDFDAQYRADVIENKLIIWTDKDASKGKVFITDINDVAPESWHELIPETDDNLLYITGVDGHLYAAYSHNVHIVIKIFSFDGAFIREMDLPTLGFAGVWGYWSKPTVWVRFTSFVYPVTVFTYDFDKDELSLFHKPPIDIDVSNYTAEQVWYRSKDSTLVSMFLVHKKNLKKDGSNPVYLTGYGGFNISVMPYFSTLYAVWLEAGGMVAIPNLRGGGEYGKEWHEAGMFDKKQNTFDDFIAAAEWLIENRYTNPSRLAIGGASNGGLLVGAAMVQRPDLYRVVHCGVPLLDMIRYHLFGFANIWAEEYGSADDPEHFRFLLKYSPYHNVVDSKDYPAVLFVGSDNDARCYPLHAMKMTARMQEARSARNERTHAIRSDDKPILLLVRKKSGHGGGTTLSEQIEQYADIWAFLMNQVGINLPEQ
jgi:prolyl oligopeptidase